MKAYHIKLKIRILAVSEQEAKNRIRKELNIIIPNEYIEIEEESD